MKRIITQLGSSIYLPVSLGVGLIHQMRMQTVIPSSSNALHKFGVSKLEPQGSTSTEDAETWSQFASRMRYTRRRIRTVDVAYRVGYEYSILRKLCKKRPSMRQFSVRDDFCIMNPGMVVMSPSMQSAFMRVFRLKPKGEIRAALRDIVPIIMYRNTYGSNPEKHFKPEEMIPKDQAQTLNQKRRELFERHVKVDKYKEEVLRDEPSQARLRAKIKKKLLNFQRQTATKNAVASRSVLYGERDAIGYFLFRGPPMYAALHRVFYELSKLLPHFAPKTMLDFGSGTGTAILVAKEVYDPGSLSHPLYRNYRQSLHRNVSSRDYQLGELQYDLQRLKRNNEEKKKARFMAVSALLESGELDPEDLPKDILKEIVYVSRAAAHSATQRRLDETRKGRYRDLTRSGREWGNQEVDQAETDAFQTHSTEEDDGGAMAGEEEEGGMGVDAMTADGEKPKQKTWWQKYIDNEHEEMEKKMSVKLRPLQNITAVEPSPGMMEIAMVVLTEEAQDVQWKRYLMPEDLANQQELVVAAFTLSEISTPEARLKAARDLWRCTSGVFVIVEHATLVNYDMLMQIRDAILEEKGIGIWDWQPTIVCPDPHEGRNPIRHAAIGARHKSMRVFKVDADYKSTFVDLWAHEKKFSMAYESLCYIVFARNEIVPQRAEARREAEVRRHQQDQVLRKQKQKDLYEATLSLHDAAFERASDITAQPLSKEAEFLLPPSLEVGEKGMANEASATSSTLSQLDGVVGTSMTAPLELSSSGEVERMIATLKRTPEAVFLRSGSNMVEKVVCPKYLPVPQHCFNRDYGGRTYQNTRPVSPAEMLTIREEAKDYREQYLKDSHNYLRVVRYPLRRKNYIIGTFYTPEGDFIVARIYRKDFINRYSNSPGRFKEINGFQLLCKCSPGDLFPHDVPLYRIRKLDQMDTPNTLIDVKRSLLELKALQEGEPLNLEDLDPSTLSHEERKEYKKRREVKEIIDYTQEVMASFTGVDVSLKPSERAESIAKVDAMADVNALNWVKIVSAAKRNAMKHCNQQNPIRSPTMAKKKRQMMINRKLKRV